MDFYILLGVQRQATAADIKRAYRRLARRFHPDINPGDREAAARFQQILDAYETLIDPERRRRYDSGSVTAQESGSFGFAGFDFSAAAGAHRSTTFGDLFEEVLRRGSGERAHAAERGADLHVRASISFDEAWRGADWAVTVTRQEACHACAGSGYHRTRDVRCASCEGSGVVRSVRGHMVFAKNCTSCSGTGRLRRLPCETCHGQGVETRADTLVIKLPAGIADGATVRVPGKGHHGVRGGAPGDLVVDVSVSAHPLFKRVGNDIHLDVPLAIHEAALGARVEIPTPDGPARLRVPAGTQSGQRFRLRERGVPSARGGTRGDLIVEVRLMLPPVLDERSKELLREFGERNSASVRTAIDGGG